MRNGLGLPLSGRSSVRRAGRTSVARVPTAALCGIRRVPRFPARCCPPASRPCGEPAGPSTRFTVCPRKCHRMRTDFFVLACGIRRAPRLEGRRMAERAADLAEQFLPVLRRSRQRRGLRRVHEAHELREHQPRWHDLQRIGENILLGPRNVEWLVNHVAVCVLAPPDRKFVIADAHFHVVRLARKYRERPVLRFPAKPADRAVVRHHVGMSGDSQTLPSAGDSHSCSREWPSPECFRSSPVRTIAAESGTRYCARVPRRSKSGCSSVQPGVSDRPCSVNRLCTPPSRRPVRIEFETNFPERPVGIFKRRHRVGATEPMRDRIRGIVCRCTAPD